MDAEKKNIICELRVPEDKKEGAVRAISIFELDTLVAVGYSSSSYRPVRQESGALIQLVRIPLNTIPASAIETVSNVIHFKNSDTRYLNALGNLEDVAHTEIARSPLGLKTGAIKDVDTDDNGLITRGAADKRYLKNSENLFSTNSLFAKADKAEVRKLTPFFHLLVAEGAAIAASQTVMNAVANS